LFYEGLKKDLDWDGGEFFEDFLQVREDKLSHGLFFVVLDKKEGKFFVQNRGIRVFF
jgi:hypothetical protein